jgi:hypothetical protein
MPRTTDRIIASLEARLARSIEQPPGGLVVYGSPVTADQIPTVTAVIGSVVFGILTSIHLAGGNQVAVLAGLVVGAGVGYATAPPWTRAIAAQQRRSRESIYRRLDRVLASRFDTEPAEPAR